MPATAERAEYIKTGFKTVQSVPNATVIAKYGDAARKTTDPVMTFFESQADAQAMCDERAVFLSKDNRRFNHSLSGEGIGLSLDYSQTAPQMTVIDDRRTANHPAIASEITIDFGKQKTIIQSWGGN